MLHIAQFTVPPLRTRVLFGDDVVSRLPEVVRDFGASRVLFVSSAGRALLLDRLRANLAGWFTAVDDRSAMHVPQHVVHEVLADARKQHIDLVVSVGGGSAIGLAKALVLNGGPPFVAVPTTYSGSEMTPIWGITRDGTKTTGRDDNVRPLAVLYDPLLTRDLPIRIAVPSALNALAHCVEALYAPDANPITTMAAGDGARALLSGLQQLSNDSGSGVSVRSQLLFGAYLAGLSLGMVQMGVHHKLCHVLGGSFGLPHAETHAVLLPYTYAYNAEAASGTLSPLREALGAETAAESARVLHAIVDACLAAAGAPRSLGDLGFNAASASHVASLATASPYANPRAVDHASIAQLLERATAGNRRVEA